jgi:glycosyltransferase involved in cell wall biosynthesis
MNEQKLLINILIRTSNRPLSFAKCLQSVVDQDYPNIRIIIGIDNQGALRYIPKGLEVYPVSADKSVKYFYDLYIPQLLQYVEDGYVLILDDDDRLNPNVLSKLQLEGPGLIVQLQRQNTIVPKDLFFKRGGIGFPCLIFHHSLKNEYPIHGEGAGDYYFIKSALSDFPFPFFPIIVVYSPSKGNGKCNG